MIVMLNVHTTSLALVVDVLMFDVLTTGLEIGVSLEEWPHLQQHQRSLAGSTRLSAYLASDRRYPLPGRW